MPTTSLTFVLHPPVFDLLDHREEGKIDATLLKTACELLGVLDNGVYVCIEVSVRVRKSWRGFG